VPLLDDLKFLASRTCNVWHADECTVLWSMVYSIDSQLVKYAAAVCACYYTFLLHSFANVSSYMSLNWATCWPVPVCHIQKSLRRSTMMSGYTYWTSFKLRKLKIVNRCGNSNNLLCFEHAVILEQVFQVIGQIQATTKQRCLNNKMSSIVLLLTAQFPEFLFT